MANIKKAELEKEFMTNLKELSNSEQDEIKVYCSMFVNSCEKIKSKKIQLLDDSITNEIKFYGKKKENYLEQISEILNNYENSIEKIINLYVTRFIAIIDELQNTYDNQKIAMTNCKIAIDNENEVKKVASLYKVQNYDIVIQECKKQLNECKNGMENEINQIFYNKGNALSIKKTNIFQKIINLFVGKSKIDNFVINSLNIEINQIGESVNSQTKKIQNNTLNHISIIEDGIIKTKTTFKNMLEEYGYNG